ncbi:uncharacterized protein LOC107360777 [Tetranychus urticae]|uniref:DUF19 domain-containing protein n=1 Tax=Tetranychus urticae TaxID=32264 RepID=T1K521_TETUR|nr:uncharacterized protein LOC107360777 [Tetranychus urticae]
MQYLLIAAILIVSFGSQTINGQTASCHMRELDLCTATLLVFTQNSQGIQGTEAEIERQCGYIREASSCRHNYTRRCISPLQRELVDFIAEGGKSLADEFCTPGTEIRAEYKKHAKCLSEARSQSKQCTKDLQRSLEEVSQTTWDNRVAMACCGYNRFQDCVTVSITNRCGEAALDLSRKIVRLSSSRLPEFLCQSYPSTSAKCGEILPPAGTEPLGVRSNSVLSRIFSSYTGN